jgi:hypothetical protein
LFQFLREELGQVKTMSAYPAIFVGAHDFGTDNANARIRAFHGQPGIHDRETLAALKSPLQADLPARLTAHSSGNDGRLPLSSF